MSGRDVLNTDQTGPLQLPMFMRAGDISASLTGTLDRSTELPEHVMEHKLHASKGRMGHGHGTGVYESVASHGVLNPVQLVHGVEGSLLMGQGHHRVAAATDIEEQTGKDKWVPVVHTDAREGSENPVHAYSGVNSKRAAIQDYRSWSQTTKAIGQDVGWQQQSDDINRPRISAFKNFNPPTFSGTFSPAESAEPSWTNNPRIRR